MVGNRIKNFCLFIYTKQGEKKRKKNWKHNKGADVRTLSSLLKTFSCSFPPPSKGFPLTSLLMVILSVKIWKEVDNRILTLSPPALFSAKCKSFFLENL